MLPKVGSGYSQIFDLHSLASKLNHSPNLDTLNIKLIQYPNNIDARLARAMIYEDLDRINEAIQDYQYVLSIDPENMFARLGVDSLLQELVF